MRKYLLTAKLSFQDMLLHRAQMLMWIIIAVVPIGLSMLIFKSMGDQVDQAYITGYFLLGGAIYLFAVRFMGGFISERIFSGEFATYLVKPYSFSVATIMREFAFSSVRLLLSLPVLAAALIVLVRNSLAVHIDPQRIVLFLVAVVGAYLMSSFMSLLVGYSAFWFDKVWFLSDMQTAVVVFFSGAVMPLVMFPDRMQGILRILPFRFMLSLQINLLLEEKLPELWELGLFVFYVLVFWLLVELIFNRGVKRFESYGN